MRATELIVGQQYVLDRRGHANWTYEGKHDGNALVLADGSIFLGFTGFLRFSMTDGEGRREIIVVPTGAEVIESAEAQATRERQQAERKARTDKAMGDARTLLEQLGFEVSIGYSHETARQPNAVGIRDMGYVGDDAPVVEFQGFTPAKLQRVLDAGAGFATELIKKQ